MPTRSAFAHCRVVKTLAAGGRGAKQLSQRYGRELVCVRHRIDVTGQRRITTVELVVDVRPIARKPSPIVGVSVPVSDRESRMRLKAAGARWDYEQRVWKIRRATATALGLRGRIVKI